MFSQKAGTFGASGRMAPAPTMAIARYEVFSMTALLCGEKNFACQSPFKFHPSALRGEFRSLRRAAVHYVCDVVQIRNQPRLRSVNRAQSQAGFKRGQFGSAHRSEERRVGKECRSR